MTNLDASYKGFKTTFSRIKKANEENEENKKITVTIEGDEGLEEYEQNDLPTAEAIKSLFIGSQEIKAYIYKDDRLVHKQLLQKASQAEPTQFKAPTFTQEPGIQSSIQGLTEQMKMMMQASEEINKMRLEMLQNSFREQIKATESLYQRRDETLSSLTAKEIELRTKEIEMNVRKKTELWETLLKGGTDLIREGLSWVKENPADAADLISALRARNVTQ